MDDLKKLRDLKNTLRPLNSNMMVGQQSTVRVLHEMRKRGNIDHAMLFWGYSGCGKTTSARIMASYLNCENPVDGEPCNECHNCRALRMGNFSDYYEVDAASNSGKEDIEKLLEGISYAPMVGKNKVYVIDECHRLSSSAWDALLKVIEEPPAYVYFMLCTTELDKVPKTIQTRAKAYSFSRISENDIFAYLCNLNAQLGKGYTDEALRLLSEISDGSMREAVNNFEHVSTPFADGEEITEDSVRKYLAIIGPETVLNFVLNVSRGDIVNSYGILDEQEKAGVNAEAFIKTVHNALSDCLSAKFGNSVGSSSAAYAEALQSVGDISLERLVSLADTFNECFSNLSERNYASLRVRVARLCVLEPNGCSISALKTEIERLKAQLTGVDIPTVTANTVKPCCDETAGTEGAVLGELDNSDNSSADTESTGPDEMPDYANGADSTDSAEDKYYAHMAAMSTDDVREGCNGFPDMFNVSDNDMCGSIGETKESEESEETENGESEEDVATLEDMLSLQFKRIQKEAEEKEQENPFAPVIGGLGDEDDEENPFEKTMTIGDYTGGIVFNSASAAGAFKASQSKANQAKAKIAEIRKGDLLFDTLVGDCSVMSVVDDRVVLDTPFKPVRQVINAYIERYSLKDTVCWYKEAVKL